MKKSRYTESQIFQILREAAAGIPVPDLCRKHGMSSVSFYKWRAKDGGMEISHMKRMKELELENARLNKMYAEEKLKADIPYLSGVRAEFDDQTPTPIRTGSA